MGRKCKNWSQLVVSRPAGYIQAQLRSWLAGTKSAVCQSGSRSQDRSNRSATLLPSNSPLLSSNGWISQLSPDIMKCFFYCHCCKARSSLSIGRMHNIKWRPLLLNYRGLYLQKYQRTIETKLGCSPELIRWPRAFLMSERSCFIQSYKHSVGFWLRHNYMVN